MLTFRKSRRSRSRKRGDDRPSTVTPQPNADPPANKDEDPGFEPQPDRVRWDSGKQVGNKI